MLSKLSSSAWCYTLKGREPQLINLTGDIIRIAVDNYKPETTLVFTTPEPENVKDQVMNRLLSKELIYLYRISLFSDHTTMEVNGASLLGLKGRPFSVHLESKDPDASAYIVFMTEKIDVL